MPIPAFDLVTHTEVFEHVPDDARAFAQLRRVLKTGGTMIFTVPLTDRIETIERARLHDGVVRTPLAAGISHRSAARRIVDPGLSRLRN